MTKKLLLLYMSTDFIKQNDCLALRVPKFFAHSHHFGILKISKLKTHPRPIKSLRVKHRRSFFFLYFTFIVAFQLIIGKFVNQWLNIWFKFLSYISSKSRHSAIILILHKAPLKLYLHVF